jgi:hypothetical protein
LQILDEIKNNVLGGLEIPGDAGERPWLERKVTLIVVEKTVFESVPIHRS